MKKFLNFETLITPALLKVLYPTLVVLYLSKYFWQMTTSFFTFNIFGLNTSFIALIYFLVIPFVLRIIFEFFFVIFRIYEYTFKLANPDTELKGVVNCFNELKKEVHRANQNVQSQTQNFNYNQSNQYNPNQTYGQGYNGQPQPGYTQPQNGFSHQPQQPPYYQGQPQSFTPQPNQPTQPTTDNPINPNNFQQ